MKDIGLVTGSSAQAIPLVVGTDTVYVHSNIVKLEKDSQGNPVDDLYQYEEIQYDKDEYIHKMSEKSDAQEKNITNTMLALCDVYELITTST